MKTFLKNVKESESKEAENNIEESLDKSEGILKLLSLHMSKDKNTVSEETLIELLKKGKLLYLF